MMERITVCAALRSAAPAALVLAGLALSSAACGLRSPQRDAYPQLSRYAGWEIEEVRFTGAGPVSTDTVEDVIRTEATECNLLGLPICIPGTNIGRTVHPLDPSVAARDVARIELFYRRLGYYGTTVQPLVEERDGAVAVTFAIAPGQPVHLDTLVVAGTEGIFDPDSLARTLPLRPGELFDLGQLAASTDTILRLLRARGHAYAEVLREYDVDQAAGRATATLRAVPGPVVVVDSIIVTGAENLGREGALQQLTFREGAVLRTDALNESQRNLYALDLVQLATVSIAPDTLQLAPDDRSRATVLVSVAEAPVHVVDARIGFGTVECLRAQVEWVSRSFGGGARRLELSGAVSKVGIGTGAGGSICNAFEGDPFRTALDYQFGALFTEPAFLGPRDRLRLNAFALRRSEPGAFQRQAIGGGIGLLRRYGLRDLLDVGVGLERRRTRSTPALFCVALLICRPQDIVRELEAPRWRNALGVSWVRDRRVNPLAPDSGYVLRTGTTWATNLLGSELEFFRWTGEGARYTTLQPRRVLSFFLRLGSFFGTASVDPAALDFLPPEERFFAGGANSVRGYGRNQLGPGVYVSDQPVPDPDEPVELDPDATIRFFPIGGTAVAVTSVELRLPAPFLSDRVRGAVFLDAGAVGSDELWDLRLDDWRVTPGVGVRIDSPVGPFRIDLAYNPHGLAEGPLFAADPETGNLIRIAERFRQGPGGLFQRFRIHVGIGEAF